MSTPITKATRANAIKENNDEILPVIDILSFCAQNQHLTRQHREVKNNESTKPQNISLFKASRFGIDGSCPPSISSWSCRTTFYRTPKVSRTRWSRTKSECSLVQEDIQQIQYPTRSGYSSPCFQGSVTPVRYRHLTHTPCVYQQKCRGAVGEQTIFVSKANINKRPRKKHLDIKTDSHGNITSISEHEFRRSVDFRRSIDLDMTSFTRQATEKIIQSESLYRPDESVLDNDQNEEDRRNMTESNESDISESDDTFFSPIKKIDIKLPF